jgi:heme/copper-type cytochrome/quinol oxidase subunit 1
MTPPTRTKLLRQPYFLFVLIAPILLLISFFVKEKIIDIHFHDTMYVISLAHIFWAIAILLFLGWGIYKLVVKVLWSKYLTWFHVVTTLFFFIFLIIISFLSAKPPSQALNWKIRNQEIQGEKIIYGSILILFIVAQICFLVNLVGGLFRRLNQRAKNKLK